MEARPQARWDPRRPASGVAMLRRVALTRKTPMARTPFKRRSARRITKRAACLPYILFVKTLPCLASWAAGCSGRVQACHVATSADQKGTGMKVPDAQAVPLCRKHHDDWDGRAGQARNPFAGWSKDERYALATEWVSATQLLAIPEDRESALVLEALGLGRIIGDGAGSWSWLPGSLDEVPVEVLTGAVPA